MYFLKGLLCGVGSLCSYYWPLPTQNYNDDLQVTDGCKYHNIMLEARLLFSKKLVTCLLFSSVISSMKPFKAQIRVGIGLLAASGKIEMHQGYKM